MPQSYHDPWAADREIANVQLDNMRTAAGGNLAWHTSEAADHTFVYVPGRVLVPQTRESDFLDVLGRRQEFVSRGESRLDDRSTSSLISYELPSITGNRARDVRVGVQVLDEEMGPGVITPEHYIHVAVNGGGKSCPATEPAETGLRAPWPPAVTGVGLSGDFHIAAVDTGWPPGAEDAPTGELLPTDPLADLAEYDGHGVFAEAILRSQAPGATIDRIEFTMQGGAVPELDLANALKTALQANPAPRVISMSAGAHTYNNQPLKAFEDLWTSTLANMPDTVLVAAAGNDSSPRPFYPAASWWAVGVGSLDADDRISDYSNYGDSADVYVIGRNHVNRFPHGTYVCQWPPDRFSRRDFRTGWARWSGTSFSTPLLAGRIAAYLEEQHGPADPTDARGLALQLIDDIGDDGYAEPYGAYRYIALKHWAPALP